MTDDHKAPARATVPLWRNVRVLAIVFQALVLIVVLGLLAFLANNAITTMAARGFLPSLDFLSARAGFDIADPIISYSARDTYGRALAVGSLASYVSDTPYENQRLGIMAPGIVRHVGDIQHLAALIAPRRLVMVGSVDGAGQILDEAALKQQFDFTQRVYSLEQAAREFTAVPSIEVAETVRKLGR